MKNEWNQTDWSHRSLPNGSSGGTESLRISVYTSTKLIVRFQ